ncbi:MAG: carboxypeptidase regulatory-like domain-containing protein, partial [Bacteroidota bacterium]|nr:carboxypeptidase regulatory-like domain-containing protein [Bacteroidota bacterium]
MDKAKIFLVIFGVFIMTNGIAQEGNIFTNLKSKTQRADFHFENYSYSTAIDLYKDIVSKDPENLEARIKIARAYKKLNNAIEAERWYRTAFEKNENQDVLDKLYFAQALMNNENYHEAKKWLLSYVQHVKDIRATNNLMGLQVIKGFYNDSASYQLQKLNLNLTRSSFSPVFYEGQLLFLSERKNTEVIKYVNSWSNKGFFDVYKTNISTSGETSKPTIFHKAINSKYHEGPLSFFNDGNSIVFTRSINSKTRKGNLILGLYTANKSNNNKDWENIQPLPFNNENYSVVHPAISNQGDTLYFSSEMPGGYGGSDLYRSIKVDGVWGNPENLGAQINTEGNELFPYIHGGNLYFSSDGHQGLGGLDIYKVDLKQKEQLYLKNMGFPFNSSYDDFSVNWDNNGYKGAFSSNRDGNKDKDDIYLISNIKAIPMDFMIVKGKVFDKDTKEPIIDASLYIIDENTGQDYNLVVSKKGQFTFEGISGHSYSLLADNPYKSALITERKVTHEDDFIEVAMWGFPPKVLFQPKVTDKETGETIKLAKVELLENAKVIMHEQTYYDGKVLLVGKAGQGYKIKVTKAGFSTLEHSIKLPTDHFTDTVRVDLQMNRLIQRLVQIKGIVVDTTENALSGARVFIYNELTGEQLELTSRKDGTFEFEALTGSVYKAIAEMHNKVAVVSDIVIKDPEVANNDILLGMPNHEKNYSGPVTIRVHLKDKSSGEGIAFGLMKLIQDDTVRLIDFSDLFGNLEMKVPEEKKYSIKGEAQGYKENTFVVPAYLDKDSKLIEVDFALEKEEISFVKGFIIDQKTGKKVPDARIYVVNEKNGESKEFLASPSGAFSFQGIKGQIISILAEKDHKIGVINQLELTERHFMIPIMLNITGKEKSLLVDLEIRDSNNKSGIPLADITITQNNSLQVLKSDQNGNANFYLQSEKEFRIEAAHKGYKSLVKIIDGKMSGEDKISIKIELEKELQDKVTVKGNAFNDLTKEPL